MDAVLTSIAVSCSFGGALKVAPASSHVEIVGRGADAAVDLPPIVRPRCGSARYAQGRYMDNPPAWPGLRHRMRAERHPAKCKMASTSLHHLRTISAMLRSERSLFGVPKGKSHDSNLTVIPGPRRVSLQSPER